MHSPKCAPIADHVAKLLEEASSPPGFPRSAQGTPRNSGETQKSGTVFADVEGGFPTFCGVFPHFHGISVVKRPLCNLPHTSRCRKLLPNKF